MSYFNNKAGEKMFFQIDANLQIKNHPNIFIGKKSTQFNLVLF